MSPSQFRVDRIGGSLPRSRDPGVSNFSHNHAVSVPVPVPQGTAMCAARLSTSRAQSGGEGTCKLPPTEPRVSSWMLMKSC